MKIHRPAGFFAIGERRALVIFQLSSRRQFKNGEDDDAKRGKVERISGKQSGRKTAAIVLFNAKEIWNEIAATFVASLFFRGREILTNLVLRMVAKGDAT